MAKIKFSGPFRFRLSSFFTLSRIAMATYARRALGKRREPGWDVNSEIGIRFWRHQFTRAMTQTDMGKGRAIFDSLMTETDDIYRVSVEKSANPKGRWYRPRALASKATLLYFHGGGYTFNGPVSERFAAMLAHHAQAGVFMPDYRLTPEHPHPAQAEDALAAWRFVAQQTPAEQIVVIGDSAGGHMALMLLQTLKAEGLSQPGLCIGLCPWTDIGKRGESLHGNDRYDLVQGWMALQFGQWLDPEGGYGRKKLSPIAYDYSGLAPLYLQSGGHEILHDMICDFAEVQAAKGAHVMLDVWKDMPHDFQAYDSLTQASSEALDRIRLAVAAQCDANAPLQPTSATFVHSGQSSVRPTSNAMPAAPE